MVSLFEKHGLGFRVQGLGHADLHVSLTEMFLVGPSSIPGTLEF